MRHFYSASALALLTMIGATTAAVAQETTSSIRGSVASPEGPVVGANVTVTHTPSGTVQSIMTVDGGTFVLSGLRPGGPYTVKVDAAGYPEASFEGVSLTVGEPYNMPIVLDGTALEGLVVSARRPVEGASSVYNRDTIEAVASVQRDIRDIARRDPFASFNPTTRAVSVAGANGRTNRFSVDGVRFSDNFGLQSGGLPTGRGPVPVDAIEQLSVKIAPYDVAEGDFQGGAVNVVLRSGGNDFHGSAFVTYSSDGLMGDEVRGQPVSLDLKSENWGFFASGPLIKDRLFFAASYERLTQTEPAPFGLAGSPQPLPASSLSQATLDLVSGIAANVYNYDTMGLITVRPETDEKYTIKIDANLTDKHRAAYTYIHNEGQTIAAGGGSTSTSSPSLGYASYATYEPELVDSHVLQLNSSWTNNFSTEMRLNWREATKIPSFYGGDPTISQFQVCTDSVSVGSQFACAQGTSAAPGAARLFFGTEQFSQADVVGQEQYGAELIGRWILGNHVIKASALASRLNINNVFVHSSKGLYFFDSIADFNSRNAGSFSYQNSITGNLDDLSAAFSYNQYTFGLQDSWDILPNVNILYGARWDMFGMDDKSPLNPAFVTRQGFANNNNIDGNVVFQPRAQVTWKPRDDLTVRAGVGLFSGGTPDVFLGNSFSVAGRFGNTITLQRDSTSATGCTANSIPSTVPLATAQAICAAALNNVDGRVIDPLVVNFLRTNTAALASSPVNALSDDFDLPSLWKFSTSVDYRMNLGGFWGDGWSFGGDLYYGKVKNAAYYTDLRLTQVNTAPDGRPIYADTFTNSNNQDLLQTNSSRGYSFSAVARATKIWDFGLITGLSYTYSDVTSYGDMNGSTASGTYGAQPGVDPNLPAYGTSEYEIKHNVKLSADYSKEFFEGYETRVNLFADYRSGLPYSLTMNTVTNRNVYGTVGSFNRFLLYVPDVSSQTADPRVTYNSTATYTAFRDFVLAEGLTQGAIIGKNTQTAPDYFKVDLHLEQELPAPYTPGKLIAFADVENLLNLINEKYGAYRTVPLLSPVVNVNCVAAPGNACAQYSYSNFTAPVVTNNGRLGLWTVRLGMKYQF